MGLIFRKSGVPIIVIRGAVVAEAETHIRNGYPARLADFLTGRLAVEEAPDDALPAPEIVPETPEEIAEREERELQDALLRGIMRVLLNHENRLRALESKPAITTEQFKQAIKTILGI